MPTIDAAAVAEGAADAGHVFRYGRFRARPRCRAPVRARRAVRHRRRRPRRALAALGIRGGRLGLDDERLPAARAKALGERVAGFKQAAASDAFAIARLVKSPYEIDCLQQALRIAEEAHERRPRTAASRRHRARGRHRVRARGGAQRGAAPYRTIIAFGPGSAVPAPWPSDRALRLGDLVRFDLGCASRAIAPTSRAWR